MRRTIAASVSAAVLLLTGTSTVSANPVARDKLVCSRSSNGGHLAGRVCVLPGAVVGRQYEGFIITTNNDGGTFAIVAGGLPPGLFMPPVYGASGTIVGGTPTQPGTFSFTVKGIDGAGQPLRQRYRLGVEVLPLRVSFPAKCCNPATLGRSYLQNFFMSGGVPPHTAAIGAGRLPPGLSFSTSPPVSITGTPTTSGTFHITVVVTDSTGARATKSGRIVVS